jgi:hypothetical protein
MKTFLLVLIIGVLTMAPAAALSEKCSFALKDLFGKEVDKKAASEFLALQGDLTLHRLAWAYLKAQAADQSDKAESVERTIIELLNSKYTQADPEFIKARTAFENQPLSRTTLAEVAPFLRDVLSHEFPEDKNLFKLNQSDIKMLSLLARHERLSARNGKFDDRMFQTGTNSILNFTKLINSSYKLSHDPTEANLQVSAKLAGLEKYLEETQRKMRSLVEGLTLPQECLAEPCLLEEDFANLIQQHSEVEKIFWESLAPFIESDDIILEKLSYGDLWLKIPKTDQKKSVDNFSPSLPQRKTQVDHHSSSTPTVGGLLVQNSDLLILENSTRLRPSTLQTLPHDFKIALAAALIADQRILVFQGKLYDPKTARPLSHGEALLLLPPIRRESLKINLARIPESSRSAMLAAVVNGEKTFILDDKLFSTEGKILDPKKEIAQKMGNKLGLTVDPARYNGMGRDYLLARAWALTNDKPYFEHEGKTMDTFSGRSITSPFRNLAGVEDVKLDKERRRMMENLSDTDVILNYNRENPNKECPHYGILNKKLAKIMIYENSGKLIFESEILIGAEKSDKRTRWMEYGPDKRVASHSTGAGVFKVRTPTKNDSFNRENFNNNIISLLDSNGEQTVFALHQVPKGLDHRYDRFNTGNPDDRRISGGCANLALSDFKKIQSMLGVACQLYVLPEEDKHKFAVRDGKLQLVSTQPVPLSEEKFYNYEKKTTQPRTITFNITNSTGDTKVSREFLSALEKEKKKLMSIFRMSNDEYNDLAMISYALLGNESRFGESYKLMYKEMFQGDVIIAKGLKEIFKGNNPFNNPQVTNTSRGYTQIKMLPLEDLKKHYPGLSKETLMNPYHSAVATMAYLADAVGVMKEIARKNGQDPSKLKITRENMVDYLGYIYQGRRAALLSSDPKKQATPEQNIYVQNLKKHMSYIELTQKIE